MDKPNLIKNQISFALTGTDFPDLGSKVRGKVRDIYDLGKNIVFISSDRQSAFDRNLATIPFKGQVLTQVSTYWFNQTRSIVKNHLIEEIDPNVHLCKKLNIIPIEFVVRGYLTGVTSTSVWTAYEKGDREFCGNTLPDGMKKNEPFTEPLITPTTKDEVHDEKITPAEIIAKGIMTQKEWDYAKDLVLNLFRFGQEKVKDNGLILVDTKYELGKDEKGEIYLVDEIHTPDSSRYWLSASYQERLKKDLEPENIDKEFLRLWFKKNSDPYKDKVLPQAPEDLVIELAKRYIKLYEMITDNSFNYQVADVKNRILGNLRKKNLLKKLIFK